MEHILSGPTSKIAPKPSLADRLQHWLPKLVLAPTMLVTVVCIYGFIFWTAALSMTNSRFLPSFKFVGFDQYAKLMENDRWVTSITNLGIFGVLFIVIAIVLGVGLAILLDQNIRKEGAIRTIYLYPMALSFIVTGTAWKWILNPGLGIEKLLNDWGWTTFKFDWLVNSEMSVYTLVIAAVWQSSGFVMAMFLAGLRGIDSSIIKAAQIDGASLPTIYWKIILPCLRPVFFSAVIITSHIAIKSFDLVTAMTAGGPGYSSDLPALFMYAHSFTRGQIGLGAASAMMMLGGILAILVPYLYSELREKRA
ncbi:sugar ABC transporter permease [Vibrio vulnificus]|uniref:carbohydrate ABC transporter permease n=1 Tax=Vibrio vulnificus TaxID=672 RepID=UPI000BA8619F|nr:sugar ABC transporter permease [Vibrio vulnificus]EGR0635861.1 sugar ABC transporter permease [Vibrio vulnificus]EHZ7121386.1 sugar ABC transporter permease [Vibrio vulnificus]EIJ0945132.1 sugar ABC transporter permease [Vibrio vulnificus]EJD0675757.1 sugar ABC transporter permease [Vibrio vulnificus]EJZ7971615.1 sugar ABC transporter permease [Vibrio vulnificus]